MALRPCAAPPRSGITARGRLDMTQIGDPGPADSAGPPPAPPPGLAIAGSVTAEGEPLPGARVTLTDPRGRHFDEVHTDSHGHYRLCPPSGGTYIVICVSSAHRPHATLIALSDLPVRHDFAMTGSSALSGRVTVDSTGAALAGAVVTVVDVRGDVVASATTGGSGRYDIYGVPAGTYTLSVTAGSYQPVALTLTVPAEGRVTNDVGMTGACRISGAVRSARSGRAIPEAVVTLIDAHGEVVGAMVTGLDGRYVFDDLTEGDYTITATGHAPVAADLRARFGAPASLDLTLGAGRV
ncbi:MAG: hypothetical protein GEV11_22765 [Streptosporangiales bacterium]|nr:hypothetical protein [Streptosporangiales bacterium]